MSHMIRFLRSETGATAVEYAVMLAGILAIVIAGITMVGGESANFWSSNQGSLDSAFGSSGGGS